MEMCYNGALVMPRNYVIVNSNEMQYIDGGISSTWNTTAGTAASNYNTLYWVFSCLSWAYSGALSALGTAIGFLTGGPVGGCIGAFFGSLSGSCTGSILMGFANACDSAATAASKFSKSQKVKCTESLNSRLVLSISIKKR